VLQVEVEHPLHVLERRVAEVEPLQARAQRQRLAVREAAAPLAGRVIEVEPVDVVARLAADEPLVDEAAFAVAERFVMG
jgi:hypothetical protein